MAKIFGVVILVMAAIAGLAAVTFMHGFWRFHYPPPPAFARLGVDVSHHQGRIDWTRVRNSGFSFAYIKASEGSDFVDSRFMENWQMTAQVGIARGAYHFYALWVMPTRKRDVSWLSFRPT